MELKNVLSVVTAALTALGAMLYAMGSQSPWLAMALWMAVVVSLVVTDFLAAVRLPRNVASLLMWGVLAIFLPHFLRQPGWDNKLQTVASILICLQMVLLFQEKDARVHGWLAVMSLLQAVVAARYNEGVGFGGLLIAYAIVGIFALSLLVLYSQWRRYHDDAEIGAKRAASASVAPPSGGIPPAMGDSGSGGTTKGRWPLAALKPGLTSAPVGTSRSGVVTELFVRLALIGLGAVVLAAIIFSMVPRTRFSAWRRGGRPPVATVGFNAQITLGGLGQTIESPEEVMQLKLIDPATDQVYPMSDDVYLRGSEAIWYSQNRWRRTPPPTNWERDAPSPPEDLPSDLVAAAIDKKNDTDFQLGRPVVQQITMEPYLDRDDIFYIWPLIEPVAKRLHYVSSSGRLLLLPDDFTGEPRTSYSRCEVRTSGLVNGHQAGLVPASRPVRVAPCLQMPGDPWRLPRLTALAEQWRKERGLPADKHYELARWFERQLSSSGQFQYTLQAPERDPSMDAVEDFVSNNPRGHCEYFATALALMLRSQGIPSRIVLGYRCDEWHEEEKYYQVRQLHAHAWVEAFLDNNHVPEALRRSEPKRWTHGGWLRLDPTPAGEVGTQAAERTLWGAWQGRWHSLQHAWDKYVVDMDRKRQRESVYEPISRATQSLASNLFNPYWWREFAAAFWASLAATFRSGIMGWLFGVAYLAVIVIVPATAAWWLARRLARLWRRLSESGRQRRAGARSSIEFYYHFEQIVARIGLQRGVGQTPREFARAAGIRLAEVSGRHELYARAVQLAEAFYRVRFGRQVLDAAAAGSVRQALEELSAGAEKPPPPGGGPSRAQPW